MIVEVLFASFNFTKQHQHNNFLWLCNNSLQDAFAIVATLYILHYASH